MRFRIVRVPVHLMACAAVAGLSLGAANTPAEAATYYKFYTGNSYTGLYSGTGSTYAAIQAASTPTSCPTQAPSCTGSDLINDPLNFAGLTATAPSGTSGSDKVWLDAQPANGGLGVSDASGDDQINGTDALLLTFASQVTINGIATLFDPAHATFGSGDPATGTFLLSIDGAAPLTLAFADVNTIGMFNLTGTTFKFMENLASGGNVEYYVSGLSVVPLPGAFPLFASGLAGLGWLARRRRKPASHA